MIHKQIREKDARTVINYLEMAWRNLNGTISALQNTAITYSTIQLLEEVGKWQTMYSFVNTFNTDYGTWFAQVWPEYAIVLTDTLQSLQNINNIINTGLQTYYWDPDTNKPVISDVSQTHRNALATQIQAEMES